MPDVHEATGEAETYINAYSNKGKTSTHNSEEKKHIMREILPQVKGV